MTLRVTIRRTESIAASGSGVWATDQGAIAGVIGWATHRGDQLELVGDYDEIGNGTLAFIFQTAIPVYPDTWRGAIRFAVERTKGLGDAKRREIEAHYGAWWDTESVRGPLVLGKLGGLTAATRLAWVQTVREMATLRAQVEVYAYLYDRLGLTTNLAKNAWELWGVATIPTVQADPYVLTEVKHYGFTAVDRMVAPRLGLLKTDPRRIAAGLRYACEQMIEGGDTVFSVERLRRKAVEELGLPPESVPVVDAAIADGVTGVPDRLPWLVGVGVGDEELTTAALHGAAGTIVGWIDG